MRKPGDFPVDLNAFDAYLRIIACTLAAVGAGTHPQNQHFERYARFRLFLDAGHHRRRHGIVIVHARQLRVLTHDGLDTEEDIRGENDAVVRLLHLQIVVNRLALIQQIVLPEGEIRTPAQYAAQQKQKHCRCGENRLPPDAYEI